MGGNSGYTNRRDTGQRFGGKLNALARDNSSAGVSSYAGAGDSTADAKAIAANRRAMAGNEDPIAYAVRIAKEKKALADAKAKAKEKAEAEAKLKAEQEAAKE